jgi:diguanylate cyclase (GGDEF)-like protein/PAS domain S-box-containing protein
MTQAQGLAGQWRHRLCRPAALPWLVLAGGLLTTGLFCNSERQFRQLEHERIETTLAADITEVITARLVTTTAMLDAAVGLFDASEKVTLREFKAFFRSLSLHGDNLKGIQGVGFSARVPSDDIAAFEQQIRSEGQPDFRIRPAGRRAVTSAIVYLQPSDWRNQRAIGFDMYSEATRRAAMQEAADTGEPSLSGPVRLVQETNRRPQTGTLLYLPIYSEPSKPFQSTQERMRRLRGWAYAPMRMGDLINSALASLNNPDKAGTGVLIYDGTKPSPEQLLYDNLNLAGSDRLTHPTWVPVSIANRTWLIGIQLDHRNVNPSGWSLNLMLTALLGVSISSLAAVVTRNLVSNHTALELALRQEQAAAQERALATTVFDSSPVAIVVTDANGFILRVNQAFTQLSGYSALEARGRKANLLRSGRHDDAFYAELWESIIQRGHWSGEIWNRHRNGQIRRHELNITAVLDDRNQIVSFVGLLQDVTERYDQQEEMRHLATHDQLTGLANRNLLMEQLISSLALARRQDTRVALLFIDLNRFKPVNDRYGHSVGDALLQAVAERLRSVVRESDTLCRQGGDEFVLLLPNAPDLEQLRTMATKLQMELTRPYENLPADLSVSASFGIARWPDHAEDADGLLEAADNAMYAAKQQEGDHIAMAAPPSRTPSSP